MRLARVELVGDADLSMFPTVDVVHGTEAVFRTDTWRDERLDFWAFDREVDAIVDGGHRFSVDGMIAREVLTRAQRRIDRRNAASATPWFDRVLRAHRALHDVAKPLVRADLDHALDAWQWTLRLDADASAAVQLATLLHDIERLASEADVRIEHRALDYQAFKDAHAREGARIARGLLADVDPAITDDVARLVELHERKSDDAALRTINDADALSFFSLNSAGYLAYFGTEQTQRKVSYTLARMSGRARDELPLLRMPAGIRSMIERWH
ncbi:MAG TPA: DUF4202 family protein [Kofleriaceae bacterium]|nr:DUF4202 family protein [Kofleriaceae bacterium]